ncbi:CHASE2 domain-containing protein, partial [Klebsiella pneumoniae]|uniref:CHASE2 domain-containing protein n=1 Tax=Klebsiella pneumoniae TaxID=573 RepID=UPI0034E027BB
RPEQGARDRSPFTTYSYIDVLRGRIPAAAFRGTYVRIGPTAAGLGAQVTAPLGASARPISSVEMLAHVLNGSLQGSHVHRAS